MSRLPACGESGASPRIWQRAWRTLCATARLACGVPDYDTYVAHVKRCHPERTVPTYAEFFAERQQARYSAGRGRCC